MIHDILLSCLNLHSKHLLMEEFMVSDALSTFLHPCEKKILEDIIKIVNLLRNIAKFTKIYGTKQTVTLNTSLVDTDEPLQNGLYLKAFVNGIDKVLDDFIDEITELEKRYLQNPTKSLMLIYQKLKNYEPLALYLVKLIRGIRINKFHGCAIIQYLQQNCLHGDARIYKAMKIIQASVNVVFLKQLTHWLLYAKIVDTYGEFFIQSSENNNNNNTVESEHATSTGSGKAFSTISETASTYTDIWRYEICYEFLPQYLSSNWAEKVLFIGQTVLIFKVDANKLDKNVQLCNKTETALDCENLLWNKKEHIYFGKIQALQYDVDLNVSHYERVIDEIKIYVTSRLSEIAVNQADLVHQLKLVKDFYLLGRGELFHEYVRQIYVINKMNDSENKLRDYVKAFDLAAHAVGVSEDIEQFSISIPKTYLLYDDELYDFDYLQIIQLQYKINWPLHLLFSPKVIERYNVLFRFLLLIRKIQYELHMMWCQDTRELKPKMFATNPNIKKLHLRNQLMFFIDSLQYYVQVDVLECQFNSFLQTIMNKADFEQIQRAHSIFQTNVLSSCYLISEEDVNKASLLQNHSSMLQAGNPVHLIFNEIFHICQEFCNVINNSDNDNRQKSDQKIIELDERFCVVIKQLINLLVGFKAAPSATPLSQLLLQLDFNHWFSMQKTSK